MRFREFYFKEKYINMNFGFNLDGLAKFNERSPEDIVGFLYKVFLSINTMSATEVVAAFQTVVTIIHVNENSEDLLVKKTVSRMLEAMRIRMLHLYNEESIEISREANEKGEFMRKSLYEETFNCVINSFIPGKSFKESLFIN